MAEPQCRAVHRWLSDPHTQAPAAVPPPELVDHVAVCAPCRGLVATAVAALIDLATPPAPIGCADCEHELDALIDYEERLGTAAAARRYPQVWWHLLTCAECAEVYAGVHALLHAEATGVLAPLALAPIYEVFRLMRSYLHAALAPQMALGVAWGVAEAQQIDATSLGPYQLALAAYPTTDTTVTFVVQIEPPAAGSVALRLDSLVLRAAFAADGTALLPDLPVTLFAADSADAVCVELELDDPFA